MSTPSELVHVLIADDDAITREIAAAMLGGAGFIVQAVAGGDAALAACALRMPDIALLDVEMPEGDGYQACARIRSLPGGMDLPIVMVTGCDDTRSIDRAYQAGATDFVAKPINWPLLAYRIRYVLRGARTVEALRATDARIHRLAYFDALTGLPNREWLREFLSQSLAAARDRATQLALLYVDLDQFKRINDTLGRGTGDALLCQVAERLQSAFDPQNVAARIARVGGDEFAIVLEGADLSKAKQAAQRVASMHEAPIKQGNYELVATLSIGLATFPDHGADAESLLKNAEAAMYEAKSSGRNQLSVHDVEVNARALKRLSLEMELRRAIEDSKLDVFYQPKFGAQSLELTGGEALLRWFHPERGQIPTAEFIAVAEETGLIGDIGRWTLQRVCADLCRWREEGLALPHVAVNVSGRDFMRPQALLQLGDIVSHAGLSPSQFELELTEGVLMRDAEAGRRSLLSLKEFGFSIAIDDFGTGYCSLNYLKRFPLDTLKIDRSFVADITDDADDAAIVRAIIALGHSLDLKIVAEGVTTSAQLRYLQAEGCDAIQGFLMSAAVPPPAFREMLCMPRASVEFEAVPARLTGTLGAAHRRRK
ncbi:MAG TPA: EAL domain-containing protein [Steroidobacteraceae bacterium]|jgi:diguanylate cyclase (GGDEF)-like protein